MVANRTTTALAAMGLLLAAGAAHGESVLKQMQQEVSGIVAKSRKAVVTVEDGIAFTANKPFPVTLAPKSGTGFSIGDGYILTTADVLSGMKSPTVLLDNGTRCRATLVGLDEDLNVGLVRLDAKADIPALKLGDSTGVQAGFFAITIGNQTGQDNSAALMMIGGVRTEATSAGRRFYPHLIQIAGTVGAGTSGAPLLDADGHVIGIMAGVPADSIAMEPFTPSVSFQIGQAPSASPSDLGQVTRTFTLDGKASDLDAERLYLYLTQPDKRPAMRPLQDPPQANSTAPAPVVPENLNKWFTQLNRKMSVMLPVSRSAVSSAGFAIPISDIMPVVDALRAGKNVRRAWIGLGLADVPRMSEQNGVIESVTMTIVTQVVPGSPAELAGIKAKDEVVKIGGKPVKTGSDISAAVLMSSPGNRLTLQLRRDGKLMDITTTLAPRPDSLFAAPTKAVPRSEGATGGATKIAPRPNTAPGKP